MSQIELRAITNADGEGRLDRWFKRYFPHVKHGQLEKLCRTGQVRVDGRRVKPNSRVEPGQQVRLPPQVTNPLPDDKAPDALSKADQELIKSLVIYEDEHLLALNKPSGLAVQGGSKTRRHVDGLLAAFGTGVDKPRLVHRLDRDTSGLLLVAKTPAVAKHLTRAFADRKTEKTYLALVAGVPKPKVGQINVPLIKGTDLDRERMRPAQDHEKGDGALTSYKVLSQHHGQVSLVALRPHTGRTHQLRVHMEAIGHPIVADPKYGNQHSTERGEGLQLQLHAESLAFEHPDGYRMQLRAPLSETFLAGLARYDAINPEIPDIEF